MQSSAVKDRKSRRNVLVIAGLLGSLSLTSALLLALAPAPLLPEPRSLLVLDSTTRSNDLDQIFETQSSLQASRWQYIYIHHSKTRRSEAGSTGDHFLITSPNDSADGQVQIRIDPRWTAQKPAALHSPPPPRGGLPAAASVSGGCITICLVGDYDQSAPPEMQLRRLEQLVTALQRRLLIPGKKVIAYDQPNSPSGLGRLFPVARLRSTLLP